MKLNEKMSFDLQVPDGEYTVRIGDPVFGEDADGNATNTLRIPLIIVGGDYDGATVSTFCPLDKKIGQNRFAAILGYSRVVEQLEKELKLRSDLTIAEFGKTYLDVTSEKSRRVINLATILLPGNLVKVELRTRTYTDKEGNERSFQDIHTITFAETATPASKKEKVEKKEDDEDSW